MDELLKLLRRNSSLTPGQIAPMLEMSEADVTAKIRQLEENQTILAYHAVLNEEKLDVDEVRAVIEVKITPDRNGGFDRIAERVARYSEVSACYLMSGGYDLLVVVEGDNLKKVAGFVSEKLATIEGVLSTATHFMLKTYKQQGVLMRGEKNDERLAVSP